MAISILRAADALPELYRLEAFARQHTAHRRAEHRVLADLVTAFAPERTVDQLEALHAAEVTRLHTITAALALIRRGLSRTLPPEGVRMMAGTKASTAEQVHQALVEQRMYRYPGAAGLVRRWFIVGNEHPFRTQAEAMEVAARQHERRGQS